MRLMMVGAHVMVRRRGRPVHGSIVDETRNAEDRREVPGRAWVGDLGGLRVLGASEFGPAARGHRMAI